MNVLHKDMLLYAITDNRCLNGVSLEEQVRLALEGGATFLQLRDKESSHEELVKKAIALKNIAKEFNVPFVVNDDVMAAKESDADGVHIGQSDMNYKKAREILGHNKIIGVTAKTVELAKQAQRMGADYIGTGAIFESYTKKDAVRMDKKTLIHIADSVDIPVVAIGGIAYDNMDYLKNTGVSGVAVVSAIFGANDIKTATNKLHRKADELFDYRKKNIIFDLDGTLFDSMPFWSSISREYAQSKGIELPDDFSEATYTMDMNECCHYFQTVLNIDIETDKLKKEVLKLMEKHYAYDIPMKPGMRRLIIKEKEIGSRMCIFTNSDEKCADMACKRMGIRDCFELITTSYNIGINKKNPASYQKICELMGFNPSETIVYEDVYHAVKTAKSAGCKTIAVFDKDSEKLWNDIVTEADDFINLDVF